MARAVSKEDVLRALQERGSRALHLSEICTRVGVPKRDRDQVLDVLEELTTLGLARQLTGRRFRAARGRQPGRRDRTATELTGRLGMHESGFGFVADEAGGPDVFIPPSSVGAALHGDRVQVRAWPAPRGLEGQVVEVLDRAARRVAGTLRQAGGNTWIDPDDRRMRGPMTVGSALPKGVRPGVEVLAEILRYPRFADEVPDVRVLEVMGAPGVTAVEVAKLKLRHGVVEEFRPEVLEEAAALPERVSARDRRGRKDLREFELVTIDPADARDHDDAVWAERLRDGGFRVIVAIADVSHYVQPGTAMDREAFERGTSIYLPDRAIPMLPPALSTHLASLKAKTDRLALAVEIELGPNGGVRRHHFAEAVMRSRAALTYEGVAHTLELSEHAERQREAESFEPMLRVLLDASRVLRRRRKRRGSIDFDLPEAKVRLNEADEPVDVVRSRRDPGIAVAYQLIEEMMLLTNEVVATDLARRDHATIYRVHDAPDEDKLLTFVELAESLGHRIRADAKLNAKELGKLIARVRNTPHEQPLNYLLLRAMQQASYSVKNIGHFALAAKHYLHFTSPIRRYPDLAVHRVVRSIIRKESVDVAESRRHLTWAAVEGSRLERRAMLLERDSVDLYAAVLMRDRVGEEFDTTVTGIAGHGIYCTFDEPYVTALVPAETLDDSGEVDGLGVAFIGHQTGQSWRLGDRLRVRLDEVSVERGDLVAVPAVGAKERKPETQRSGRGRRGSPRGTRRPRKGRTTKGSSSSKRSRTGKKSYRNRQGRKR